MAYDHKKIQRMQKKASRWIYLLKVFVEVDDGGDDQTEDARGPDGFPEKPSCSVQVTPTVEGRGPAKLPETRPRHRPPDPSPLESKTEAVCSDSDLKLRLSTLSSKLISTAIDFLFKVLMRVTLTQSNEINKV